MVIIHASHASSEFIKKEECDKPVAPAYHAFSMANIYFQHKMLKEAEEMLREAVILDGCSTSLKSQAADLFLKMGKEEEADYFSRKALEIDSEDLIAIKVQALIKGMKALMLKNEKMLNESLTLSQSALERDEKDSRIYALLAKLHFEKGNIEEAARLLGKYLSLFHRSLEPIFLVTDLIKESERSAYVERFLSALISQENINPRTILMIGNILESGGYLRMAQQLYHQASLQFQDSSIIIKDGFLLYELGRFEESMETLERLETPLHEEDSILRILANAQRKVGRMKSAQENYQKLFQRHPQDSSLAAEIGDFYHSIGDLKSATSYFKLALEFQPDAVSSASQDSPKIMLSMRIAMLLILEGDYEEAKKILAKSKKYGSVKDIRYYILSSRVEEKRSLKKALKIIQKAKKEFPSQPRLLVREAELYLSLDKNKALDLLKSALEFSLYSKEEYLYISRNLRDAKQFEWAEQILQEALTLYPDSDILLEMGALMERWKRFHKAETFLKKSIQIDPKNAIALNYLGYMLAEQSDKYEEALSYVQRALELDQYNGAYLDSIGFIYLKMEKYHLAERNILMAAEIYPFDPEIRDHLGDLYFAQGETEKAIMEWKSALQLNIEAPKKIKSKISNAQSLNPLHEE
jgi:tetratricopeptide (TPR) repeat protein